MACRLAGEGSPHAKPAAVEDYVGSNDMEDGKEDKEEDETAGGGGNAAACRVRVYEEVAVDERLVE